MHSEVTVWILYSSESRLLLKRVAESRGRRLGAKAITPEGRVDELPAIG